MLVPWWGECKLAQPLGNYVELPQNIKNRTTGGRVGGRFRREGTCLYLELSYNVVQQKRTKYFKAIILQLKFFLKRTTRA